MGISNHTVRTDLHAVFQRDVAFKDTANVNQHISTAVQCAAHIDTCRVHQGHALLHELLRLQPLRHEAIGPR